MSIENVSYNNIDDVFVVLENGFERRRQEQIRRENELNIKRDKEASAAAIMIEEAIERSIKEEDWRIQEQKIAEKDAEDFRRKFKTTIISVLIGATLISPFAFITGKAVINKFEHWKDVSRAVSIQSNEAREELLKHRLAYIDGDKLKHLGYVSSETPFTIRNNSAQDYKVLSVKDYVDVYIYKKILPDNEFNDFIQSITYTDVNGNVSHYVSFEQYLIINGFPDENTFNNYAEEGAYNREVLKNKADFISTQNVNKGGRS